MGKQRKGNQGERKKHNHQKGQTRLQTSLTLKGVSLIMGKKHKIGEAWGDEEQKNKSI